MGWQDREYNRQINYGGTPFSNPLRNILQYALPIYRSASLYIHLSFWFLLISLFVAIENFRVGTPMVGPISLLTRALMAGFTIVLLHEFGHCIGARMVGGNHWEYPVIWPMGGLVPPTSPRTDKAVFTPIWAGFVFNLGLLTIILGKRPYSDSRRRG